MLDGVHGETRPRPWIDIVVMQLVHSVVEKVRVDQAMHEVEVPGPAIPE